jgi:hypothetical protein
MELAPVGDDDTTAAARHLVGVELLSHDDNGTRHYQDDAALGAYRDSAVFMERRLRAFTFDMRGAQKDETSRATLL